MFALSLSSLLPGRQSADYCLLDTDCILSRRTIVAIPFVERLTELVISSCRDDNITCTSPSCFCLVKGLMGLTDDFFLIVVWCGPCLLLLRKVNLYINIYFMIVCVVYVYV